jgi:NAD(P)H-flavin reductase
MFYQEELSEIQKKMRSLDIEIYLSQEKTPETKHGYVTESITQELVDSYEYFCLCGSPAMVSSAREKLAHL